MLRLKKWGKYLSLIVLVIFGILFIVGDHTNTSARPGEFDAQRGRDNCYFPTGVKLNGESVSLSGNIRESKGVRGDEATIPSDEPFLVFAEERIDGNPQWIVFYRESENELAPVTPVYIDPGELMRTDEFQEGPRNRCRPSRMDPPQPATVLTEDNMLEFLGVDSWRDAGYDGSGVDIAIIDSEYGEPLEYLLEDLVLRGIDHSLVYPLVAVEKFIEDDRGIHGTQMLTILAEIAPGARFHIIRARDSYELREAVDLLLNRQGEERIEIVVHAVNTVVEEEAYQAVVRRAQSQNILWVNSAGNIGAGYYTARFEKGNSGLHVFNPVPNKAGSRPTLSVPFNRNNPPRIWLTWEPVSEGNYLNLAPGSAEDTTASQFVPGFLTDALKGVSREKVEWLNFLPDEEAGLELFGPDSTFDLAPLEQVFTVEYNAEFVDYNRARSDLLDREFDVIRRSIEPLNQPQLPESDINIIQGSPDGITDNLLHINISDKTGTISPDDQQAGVYFEIFIEGALPPEYNPYAFLPLDPVVTAPGDIAESFTVGSFEGREGNLRMAWYSGRYNGYQYELNNRIIKPDVVTFGDFALFIEFPDGEGGTEISLTEFRGTSPSTAVIGGIAALLASCPNSADSCDKVNNFDAGDLARILREQHAQCLNDDGAVGQVIKYIGHGSLQAPDQNEMREGCKSYEWWGDFTAGFATDADSPFGFAGQRGTRRDRPEDSLTLALSSIPPPVDQPITDGRYESDLVNIRGGQATAYYIDYRLSNTTDSPENWNIYLRPEVLEVLELSDETDTPEVSNCLRDEVAFTVINNTNNFRITLDTTALGRDGDYILRVNLCRNEEVVDSTLIQPFSIANTIEPEIVLNESTLATVVDNELQETVTLEGTAIAEEEAFIRYFVQIARDIPDVDSEVIWQDAINVVGESDSNVPEEMCQEAPEQGLPGSFRVDDRPLGDFVTTGYEDGNWLMRLVLCYRELPEDGEFPETPDDLPVGIMIYPSENDGDSEIHFLINHVESPFAEIAAPELDEVISANTSFSVNVTGDGYTGHVLELWRIVETDDSEDEAFEFVEIIAEQDGQVYDPLADNPVRCDEAAESNSSGGNFNYDFPIEGRGPELERYELRLYGCFNLPSHDDQVVTAEQTEAATQFEVDPRLVRTVAELELPVVGEDGVVSFNGTVQHPELQGYLLGIVPAEEFINSLGSEERTINWWAILPEGESAGNVLISEVSCDEAVQGATQGNLLGTWDSLNTGIAGVPAFDGTYVVKLFLCTNSNEQLDTAQLGLGTTTYRTNFTLNNDADPEITVSIPEPVDFEEGYWSISGTVVENEAYYVLAARPVNTDEDQWMLIAPNQSSVILPLESEDVSDEEETAEPESETIEAVDASEDSQDVMLTRDDICNLEVAENARYGLGEYETEGIIGILELGYPDFPNGDYEMLAVICGEDGEVLAEYEQDGSLPIFTLDRRFDPELAITVSPETVTTQDQDVVIEGTIIAYEDDFDGYYIEVVDDALNQSTLIVPEGVDREEVFRTRLENENDLCSLDGVSDLEPVYDEEIYTIDADWLLLRPDGDYQVVVTLCLNGEASRRDPAPQSDDYELALDIFQVSEINATSVVAENQPARIDFQGVISVPDEVFSHYVIELRPLTEEETGDPELTLLEDVNADWDVLIGPLDSNGDGNLCNDEYVDDSLLGTYQFPQGGTLGIFYPQNYDEGSWRVRLRVCLAGDTEDNAANVAIEERFARVTGSGPIGQQDGVTVDFIGEDEVIRSEPSETAESLISVREGDVVQLVGRTADNEWVFVNLREGENIIESGWMPANTYIQAFLDSIEIRDGGTSPNNTDVGVAIPSGVLFASDATGLWQIYRSNGPGLEPDQLTSTGNNEFPSASPDGTQIAFASDRDGNREIYIMNRDGSNERNLSNNGSEDYRPAWSPDGQTLLFESGRTGNRELYSLDLATSQVYQITSNLGDTCCVAWAASGRQITFSANQGGSYDIYIANIDGTGLTQLASGNSIDINPDWQPGGSTVVFQSDRSGTWQIYTVSTSGVVRQLTSGPGNNIQPAWLGGQIIYSREGETGYDLYIMDADGNNQRPRVDGPGTQAGGQGTN